MKNGIIVYWSDSQEILEFDYSNFESIQSIKSSSEWWDSGGEYQYNIEPEITRKEAGSIEVNIKYLRSQNAHIKSDEVSWGISSLTLKPDADSGEASWFDSHNPEENGTVRWVRLDAPLKSKIRRRITTTKLQREQAKFRKLLLKFDKQCVLTGEPIETVLEAAHIIAVSDGGPDIPANGIMLRCDLHRLYDSKAFVITPDGIVKPDENLCGSDYTSLLHSLKLPESTLKRVTRALAEKEA